MFCYIKNFDKKHLYEIHKFLFEDLKHSDVYLDNGELIGKVTDVQDFGSAEVISVIQTSGKELMFPNVSGIIISFDYITKN